MKMAAKVLLYVCAFLVLSDIWQAATNYVDANWRPDRIEGTIKVEPFNG